MYLQMCLQALVEVQGSSPHLSMPHTASMVPYTTRPLRLGYFQVFFEALVSTKKVFTQNCVHKSNTILSGSLFWMETTSGTLSPWLNYMKTLIDCSDVSGLCCRILHTLSISLQKSCGLYEQCLIQDTHNNK